MERWRDDVRFPDLTAIDWEKYAARDTANWDREKKISSVILINGLFESLHMCCGIENALCALLMYPDEVKEFLEDMADHQIRVIRNLAKSISRIKSSFPTTTATLETHS
jgi:uroporphyrinogen decarboxylase